MRLVPWLVFCLYGSTILMSFPIEGLASQGDGIQPAAVDCSRDWVLFSSKPREEGAYPDTNVTYYRYVYRVPANREITIELKGEFPKGRYLGFNLYDTASLNSEAGLADINIKPDVGSTNPFKTPSAEALSKNEKPTNLFYTVRATPSHITAENQLPYPDESLENERTYEIWYRIYEPEIDALGGVKLPTISAIDTKTSLTIACPEKVTLPVSKLPKTGLKAVFGGASSDVLPKQTTGEVYFYHHKGAGLYANKDTHYLATLLPYLWEPPSVIEFKFKAPTTPLTAEKGSIPDVRYWSLCAGGSLSTITYGCLSDKHTKVDAEGFVKLYLGPSDIKEKFTNENFLEVPKAGNIILIYRNLLPEKFDGDFSEIPAWTSARDYKTPNETLKANHFIGDYSPKGIVKPVE